MADDHKQSLGEKSLVDSVAMQLNQRFDAINRTWPNGEDDYKQSLSDFNYTEFAQLSTKQRGELKSEFPDIARDAVRPLLTEARKKVDYQDEALSTLRITPKLSFRRPFRSPSTTEGQSKTDNTADSKAVLPVELVLEFSCDQPDSHQWIYGSQCVLNISATMENGYTDGIWARIAREDMMKLDRYTETDVDAAKTPIDKPIEDVVRQVLDSLKEWLEPDPDASSSDSDDLKHKSEVIRKKPEPKPLMLAKLTDNQMMSLRATLKTATANMVTNCREKAANYRMDAEQTLDFTVRFNILSTNYDLPQPGELIEIEIEYSAGLQSLHSQMLSATVNINSVNGVRDLKWGDS